MLKELGALFGLSRAGFIILRHGGLLSDAQRAALPFPTRAVLRLFGKKRDAQSLATALTKLGPSYIKLGQFLATRGDLIGDAAAGKLALLQDRLQPFSMAEARAEIRKGLGADADELFTHFSEPIAAASIAQVHKAVTRDGRTVAVKILRPRVEQRFARDLDGFFLAARMAERFDRQARRLKPVAAVEMLAQSVRLEMDLRMEAAAMSEIADNTDNEADFRVPKVDWKLTSERVLTSEWVDGTKLSDMAALAASGLDLHRLGDNVIQSFLRHAIRDGFFHGDMHPGNLFADAQGRLVAVDYGIMGRLSIKERRFLAEILHGFITRDYARVSAVHFEAGYVPADQDPALFAQALRAIGEPIQDRTASDISMGRLLTQLFETTGKFNMQAQPQLLLLQKTMVVVEGVARQLNPELNMWATAEPVVRDWVTQHFGVQGRLEDAAQGVASLGALMGSLPQMLGEAQRATHLLAGMAASGGLRLDAQSTQAIAKHRLAHEFWTRAALWTGAIALLALVVLQVL
jgi:ubiquinone biosynthesis protein